MDCMLEWFVLFKLNVIEKEVAWKYVCYRHRYDHAGIFIGSWPWISNSYIIKANVDSLHTCQHTIILSLIQG